MPCRVYACACHTYSIYPTRQNHSLELMFAKFATAENCETFKPTKIYPRGVSCLKTILLHDNHFSNGSPHWGLNNRSSDYKSSPLPLSYAATCARAQKILRLLAKHLTRVNIERRQHHHRFLYLVI